LSNIEWWRRSNAGINMTVRYQLNRRHWLRKNIHALLIKQCYVINRLILLLLVSKWTWKKQVVIQIVLLLLLIFLRCYWILHLAFGVIFYVAKLILILLAHRGVIVLLHRTISAFIQNTACYPLNAFAIIQLSLICTVIVFI